MEDQKKILCVGLVCLDIISVVDKYPEEDSDSRLVPRAAADRPGAADHRGPY